MDYSGSFRKLGTLGEKMRNHRDYPGIFLFSFKINLISTRTYVQFKFIFIVFGGCKTCVNIYLSIFLSVDVLNQNTNQPKPAT
ncbi:hypothetical protein Hanom_Chr16g01462421 [Helianthus anomalus]